MADAGHDDLLNGCGDSDVVLDDSNASDVEIGAVKVAVPERKSLLTDHFKPFVRGDPDQEAAKTRSAQKDKDDRANRKLEAAKRLVARDESAKQRDSDARKARRYKHRERSRLLLSTQTKPSQIGCNMRDRLDHSRKQRNNKYVGISMLSLKRVG